MFLALRGFFFAAVLWFVIVRITKDEEGIDYTDVIPWVVVSLVAQLLVRGAGYVIGLPEALTYIVSVLAGLGALWWFVSNQYGGSKGVHIILAYVGVQLLFALPLILMWTFSVRDTNP